MNFSTYFASGYLVACFVVVLGVLVPLSLAQGDCWTTGCQPSDWAVVGCEQYQRSEQGTEPCEDDRGVSGLKYTCCANQAFGDDANFEGNSRRFRADVDEVYGDGERQKLEDDGEADAYQDW